MVERREFLKGMLGTVAYASMVPNALAGFSSAHENKTIAEIGMSDKMANAWKAYDALLAGIREHLYSRSWAGRPDAQMAARHLFMQVQTCAFNIVVGSKRDCPNIGLHTGFLPLLYTHSLPSADFNYRFCLLDGSNTYGLSGKRNSSLLVDIQLINKFFGQPNPEKLANYELDDFELKPDGSFEIILSAKPQEGNWIKLDPNSKDNTLFLREVVYDWDNELSINVDIERLNAGEKKTIVEDENEFIRRLDVAGNYIKFLLSHWSCSLSEELLEKYGTNIFSNEIFATNPGAGNHPDAIYPGALYQLHAGEALIVECEIPKARYWNVQLGDPYWQVLDFTHHQTSLNVRRRILTLTASSEP